MSEDAGTGTPIAPGEARDELVSITSGAASLAPYVAPYMRDLPGAVLAQQLVEAAGDWCRDTESWRETLPVVATVAGQRDYTLAMPEQDAVPWACSIIRLIGVTQGRAGAAEEKRWTVRACLTERGVLRLEHAAQRTGDEVYVQVVLQPRAAMTLYPQWLLDRWRKGIIARAKELLHGMASKPWADPAGQAEAAQIYREQVGDAKRELLDRRQSGPIVATMRVGW